MTYNPSFHLNPRQLELIEDALRTEMTRIGKGGHGQQGEADQAQSLESIKEINELLAHIHHQKSWFKPKEFAPQG